MSDIYTWPDEDSERNDLLESLQRRLQFSASDDFIKHLNERYRRILGRRGTGKTSFLTSGDPLFITLDRPTAQGASAATRSEERDLRSELLIQLVDEELLTSKYQALFQEPVVTQWRLRFQTLQPEPLREYVPFLQSLVALYELALSLQIGAHFATRWLRGRDLRLPPEHELRLVSISRASPDDVKLEGIGAGLKAVGDALSIGKQYQEIRTAQEKIREAKAAARKAELEVEEKERAVRLANGVEAESLRLAVAQKRSELRTLLVKAEEEELALRRLRRQDLDETLSLLQKHAPVLEKLPEALRDKVMLELTQSISVVQDSPFEIIEYVELSPQPSPK